MNRLKEAFFDAPVRSLGWLWMPSPFLVGLGAKLQMVVNATIHCATLADLGWLMSPWREERCRLLLWPPLALVAVEER